MNTPHEINFPTLWVKCFVTEIRPFRRFQSIFAKYTFYSTAIRNFQRNFTKHIDFEKISRMLYFLFYFILFFLILFPFFHSFWPLFNDHFDCPSFRAARGSFSPVSPSTQVHERATDSLWVACVNSHFNYTHKRARVQYVWNLEIRLACFACTGRFFLNL